MTKYSRRAELDLIGRAFALNGPMTAEQILATVGAQIPPEKAFSHAVRKNKDELPQDVVVASGRRAIIRARINSMKSNGLCNEHEGLFYPSPRFRRDYPELFIEELRSRPDLHELGHWCAKTIVGALGDSGMTVGLRRAIRQMLKMVGRAVEPGEPGNVEVRVRKRAKKESSGDQESDAGEEEISYPETESAADEGGQEG